MHTHKPSKNNKRTKLQYNQQNRRKNVAF